MSYLKVFGSISYKHVPDARRRRLSDKSGPMILVRYHKTRAYMLFNPINDKIIMSRDIVIDKNYSWDWNFGGAINKPLISYGVDEETDEVQVEVVANIPDTSEVEEGMASTSERPQRIRVLPTRL